MDNERKMFEEYISNLKLTRLHLGKWEDLQYKNPEVMDFWKGWQARAAIQVQAPVAWMWRCRPYCDWPNWAISIKRPVDSGAHGREKTVGYEDYPLFAAPPSPPPLTDEQIDAIMEQAQVFASAWSLVGGPFDYGGGMEDARQAKDELRAIIAQVRGEK